MNKEDLVAFEVTRRTPNKKFLVSLSDGRTIIEDFRKGEHHAWIRLGDFIKANPGLHITCLRLQDFRGRDIVTMPSNQKGYAFGKKHRRIYPGNSEITYIGLGYYDGHKVIMKWHHPANLKKFFIEEKTKAEAGWLLIENRNPKI